MSTASNSRGTVSVVSAVPTDSASANTPFAKRVRISWDEPRRCDTPRGWAHLYRCSHPQRKQHGFDYMASISLCCGNYMQYQGSTRGPRGESYHASAYLPVVTPCGQRQTVPLGTAWFDNAREAREFILNTVSAYVRTLDSASRATR